MCLTCLFNEPTAQTYYVLPFLSLRRVWQRGGRGSKVKHRGGTMEGEHSAPASSASSSTGTSTSTTNSTSSSTAISTSSGRQGIPQISVYSGIPDRQTVQVRITPENTPTSTRERDALKGAVRYFLFIFKADKVVLNCKLAPVGITAGSCRNRRFAFTQVRRPRK